MFRCIHGILVGVRLTDYEKMICFGWVLWPINHCKLLLLLRARN